MFFILLRKINKNRIMILCLLLGLILSVGIVSSIPMYSRSVLRRVLTRNLEGLKQEAGLYPGALFITSNISVPGQFDAGEKTISEAKEKVRARAMDSYPSTVVQGTGIPVLSKKQTISTSPLFSVTLAGDNAKYEARPQAAIKGIAGFEEHINIKQGRMNSKTKNKNGDYEVIVSEYALNNLRLKLNARYKTFYRPEVGFKDGKAFNVVVVGVYTYKDENDSYWDSSTWYNPGSLIMNYDLFLNEWLPNEDGIVSEIGWYYALDYSKINSDNYENIAKNITDKKAIAPKNGYEVIFPAEKVLQTYSGKKRDMQTMLWILQAPMLLMLLIYMSMMSKLIVEQDKNEISLLKSRGAGVLQIIPIYLFQSILMGITALIFGPLLGRIICRIIGSSNGFMQFVQRTSLKVDIRGTEFIYSLIAIGIFIITMMVPVISGAKKSIVEHKQSKVRYIKKPWWRRFYLDFILLGITGYGFYSYRMRQSIVKITEASANSLPVDPLLYLVSTIFIIGLGLLFLRIYPYIIKLIFQLGKKRWTPAVYSSLINVGRSDGRNQFVMLFLILTVCIGIFNVKAAGTINANSENNIKHIVGADVVIETEVKSKDKVDEIEKKEKLRKGEVLNTINFATFSGLNGVSKSTRVFKKDIVQLTFGEDGSTSTDIMGIIPYEFGEIAWYKNGILPFHINEYLNVMTKDPRAMVVSRSLEKELGLKIGDNIKIKSDKGNGINGYIMGMVDYWPSADLRKKDAFLVVVNQEYLKEEMPIKPYEVWIKKKNADSGQLILNDLKNKQIEYGSLVDVDQEIVNEKNDPILQGINGSLTLGFITTMIITIIGFLIYWIMSIKERTLQFGILRSIGLSFKKLVQILAMEQLLISGVSIAVGVLIGEINSEIFLPMIRMSTNASKQILPFSIVSIRGQYFSLYFMMILMLVFVSIILTRYISSIKMDQAVKLGED